jgi:CHAT domain-containing protein/tetratricopeptide (TPR) repeat protein
MRISLIGAVIAAAMTAGSSNLALANDQSDQIKMLLAQAEEASRRLQFDAADARIAEAMALSEKLQDAAGAARSQRSRCANLSRAGRSREALAWCERALASFEAAGEKSGMASALLGLTVASVAVGDREKAKGFGERGLQAARESGNDSVRGYILLNLSMLRDTASQDANALREVIDIAVRIGDPELQGEGVVRLGNLHFARGELDAARTTYEEGISILTRASDIASLASAYVSLGRVFRAHGDYEGALARYRTAIDLLAPTQERYAIVEAVNASATALGYLGRHQEALAATEHALALARESKNPRLIDFMEGNLAGALMDVNAYEQAIPLLEAAIAKKPDPYIAAFRYNSLAIALTHVGRATEAKECADESIRLTRELKQVDLLDSRLGTRTSIFAKLGRLDEALADARETISILEGVRTRLVPADFLKRGFGDRSEQAYLSAADLLSRLGRTSEALAFAEQGRGRAFLDLLAARESDNASLQMRGTLDSLSPSGRLDPESPVTGDPVNIDGIHRIAERLHSAVLTYAVTDDATLIWLLRPGRIPVHARVAVQRDRLASLVSATTAPLRQTSGAVTRGPDDLTAMPMRGLGLLSLARDDRKAWSELYATLIQPVRTHLPSSNSRLTIVPHGPLLHLSFAALRSPENRYLVEDYELHYAPAASVFDFTARRQQAVAANAGAPWAIVGNPARLPMVGNQPLAPLPGAAREISAIAALAPKGRALRLEQDRADEDSLVRMLAATRPAVLHFATHGFVFDDTRNPPFLALQRRGTDGHEDGRLTLDEVYALTLQTDLVVLSACRSGSGTISSDGIIGLARGFFSAGAPSVMATFWDVADSATARMMSDFYRSYARAGAKAASLRTAQLELLRALRAGRVVVDVPGRRVTLPEHPLLWAGFFLSGEP